MPISADHPKDQPRLKPRSEVVSRAVSLGYFYNYLFLYLTPPYPYAIIICRITESGTARILAGHGSGKKMKQPVTASCMVRRPVNVETRVNRVDERGGKGHLHRWGTSTTAGLSRVKYRAAAWWFPRSRAATENPGKSRSPRMLCRLTTMTG